MNKRDCPSFEVDHTKLKAGVHLREIKWLNPFTRVKVWDLRFSAPIEKVYMTGGIVHAIEHIMAAKLRYLIPNKYIGFSPFGCLTGFEFISKGSLSKKELVLALIEVIDHTIPILSKDEIPALTPQTCGNPTYVNVKGANNWLAIYLQVLKNEYSSMCSNGAGSEEF